MARIRTIKPEFWASEQVMECAPLTRLMFIGIWNFCDDAGIHPSSVKTIKALVFPGDNITTDEIKGMLDELSSNDLIELYEVGGKNYLRVQGWAHQKIDKPTYKYPKPRRPLDELSTNTQVGIDPGREGSGREGSGSIHTHTAGDPFEMFLDWAPNPKVLAAYALRAGIPKESFTPEAIGPFICHHDASGACRTEKAWVSSLVSWIKQDLAKAARVVNFPKRQANGPDFENQAWREDDGGEL